MSMKITLMPGAYEGNCIECGKHFIRRQIDSFDDGAFCTRHYKERQTKTTERTCHIVKNSRKYILSDGRELFEDGCSICNGYLSEDDNYCSSCGARRVE